MAYAELGDIELAIPKTAIARLSDQNAQAPDDAVVERAITDAEAIINSYSAAGGYVVPFPDDDIPNVVRKWTVDIAIFNLYGRNIEDMQETNTRLRNYNAAIAALKAVAEGLAIIEGAERDASSDTPSAIRFKSGERIFPKNLNRYL
jgi:phage gp36-like protein